MNLLKSGFFKLYKFLKIVFSKNINLKQNLGKNFYENIIINRFSPPEYDGEVKILKYAIVFPKFEKKIDQKILSHFLIEYNVEKNSKTFGSSPS